MGGTTSLVDVMSITIQRGTGPSVRMEDIISLDITAAQESRPVFTMRRERTPRGFRHGARNVSGQFEVTVPLGGLEVDFEAMQRSKESFDALVERGDGGVSKTILGMRITEIQETGNGEGEHTFRCSFVADDYRSAAPNLVP